MLILVFIDMFVTIGAFRKEASKEGVRLWFPPPSWNQIQPLLSTSSTDNEWTVDQSDLKIVI